VKAIFADTFYWLALTNPVDAFHERAREIAASLPETPIVTTDEVLTEFLTRRGSSGPYHRARAAMFVRELLEHPTVLVRQQSRDSFLVGLEFYEARPDKSYSLTDCISMAVMQEERMTDALTGDNHFAQEGFNLLFQKDG